MKNQKESVAYRYIGIGISVYLYRLNSTDEVIMIESGRRSYSIEYYKTISHKNVWGKASKGVKMFQISYQIINLGLSEYDFVR